MKTIVDEEGKTVIKPKVSYGDINLLDDKKAFVQSKYSTILNVGLWYGEQRSHSTETQYIDLTMDMDNRKRVLIEFSGKYVQ